MGGVTPGAAWQGGAGQGGPWLPPTTSLTCSSADLNSLTKQQVQQDILTNKYLHYCLIRNSKTYRFLSKQFFSFVKHHVNYAYFNKINLLMLCLRHDHSHVQLTDASPLPPPPPAAQHTARRRCRRRPPVHQQQGQSDSSLNIT